MSTKNHRMRIAYLTLHDPWNKRSWSGSHYHVAKALEKHCGDLIPLNPVKPLLLTIGKWFNGLSKLATKKRYEYRNGILLAKRYGRILAEQIRKSPCDLIFASAASPGIAYLSTGIPIVYLSDTTFALISRYYPEYSNFLQWSLREGDVIEGLAIKNASLILYPTEWAARSALDDYRADRTKIHIVPFGANLEEVPPAETIFGKKKSDTCRLLFLSAWWKRKGGDIAFDTLLKLEEMGIRAELIVCGCVPPAGYHHRRMRVIPFLDKEDREQCKELCDLFLMSDFLLLPTRAECVGMVLCEAGAFGLPVITTDTGGVSEIVRDGENGIMLPLSATGMDYAKVVCEFFRDRDRYSALVRSSRKAFEERLNWDSWGVKTRDILQRFLQ